MSRAFTHYWRQSENIDDEGDTLRHIASNNFTTRGVERGSRVYCVNVHKRKLRLIGRMTVDQITSGQEAEGILGTTVGFWDRGEHCVAKEGDATEIRFDREIPMDIVEQLRFESSSGRDFIVVRDGKVDGQTVRPIRELTQQSARQLDHLIDD